MALPRLFYLGKTIDLPVPPRDVSLDPHPVVTINKTMTGTCETILAPHVDNPLRVEWPTIDSLTTLISLQSFWQAAKRGESWSLALDSSRTVDTFTVVDALAGDSSIYVNDPAGITVGRVYKLVDGPNYQLLTVSAITGDLVTFSETLDFDVFAGAILRDQFYFPATIDDPSAPSPIEYLEADKKPGFPPTRFNFVLAFKEVFNQESTMLEKVLSADATGANSNAVQPWFPSAGAVSVAGNTTYLIEGYLRISRAAGTNSHTTSLQFNTGTMTFLGLIYRALVNTGDTVGNIADNVTASEVATAVVVKAASTGATEQISIRITGILRVNVAGTFIPSFQYSSAPGGVPTILAGTYFRLTPLGSGSFVSRGIWA